MTTDSDPVDTAWRIHEALRDWTGKVDIKATFVLTIDSGVLVAVLALATGKHRLANLRGWALGFFVLGILCVFAAAGLSAWAVRPTIRNSEVEKEWRNNTIFFGHLKFWSAGELLESLRSEDVLPMLSRQLTVMSDIAWKKHLWLQWSVNLLVLGATCLGIAAAIG